MKSFDPENIKQKNPADCYRRDVFLVEHTGFEPVTPTLPVLCAPNCANTPNIFFRKNADF